MTLEVFVSTIACVVIAVGAIIGCLVFLYKAGVNHHSKEDDNPRGFLLCGIVAIFAILGVFALTRDVAWAFLI